MVSYPQPQLQLESKLQVLLIEMRVFTIARSRGSTSVTCLWKNELSCPILVLCSVWASFLSSRLPTFPIHSWRANKAQGRGFSLPCRCFLWALEIRPRWAPPALHLTLDLTWRSSFGKHIVPSFSTNSVRLANSQYFGSAFSSPHGFLQQLRHGQSNVLWAGRSVNHLQHSTKYSCSKPFAHSRN